MLVVTDAWKNAYPAAHVGLLVLRNVSNPEHEPGLEDRKRNLESKLRDLYKTRDDLDNSSVLKSYETYYRKFKKTYHLRLQLESLVFRGKSIPRVAALVEAMFMAEMEDLLLTAGHDLSSVKQPITLEVSDGNQRYIPLNGVEQPLKTGDMYIRDTEGVISSIILGPDHRTRIQPGTTNSIFTVYVPEGIDKNLIQHHLEQIQLYVRLFSPNAITEVLDIYSAG